MYYVGVIIFELFFPLLGTAFGGCVVSSGWDLGC